MSNKIKMNDLPLFKGKLNIISQFAKLKGILKTSDRSRIKLDCC